MKKLGCGILIALFLLPLISADLIMPISYDVFNITAIIGIIIVETILFWLLSIKLFNIEVGFWKSLLIVAIANVITSVLGWFVGFFPIDKMFYFILIAFILSVLIEWGIYLLFFLKHKNIKLKLFYLSLIVNFVSYILLYTYTLLK